jgi:hypothetical protein
MHGLVVEHIKRTFQVVQGIADDERGVDGREAGPINVDANMIAPFVHLDADGVKIRLSERSQEFIQVVDVLHGPFNLMS